MNNIIYFHYDKETGELIDKFEKPKKIESKKLIPALLDEEENIIKEEYWDTRIITKKDIQNANAAQLEDYGLAKGSIIREELGENQKHTNDNFTDDDENLTRTYHATAIPQEELNQKLENDLIKVKEYANNDILKDYEDWKQRNMTANAINVLVDLLVSQNVLTQEQVDSTELNGLKDILTTINTRRALSDQQEQDLINGVKTIEDIHNELYSE